MRTDCYGISLLRLSATVEIDVDHANGAAGGVVTCVYDTSRTAVIPNCLVLPWQTLVRSQHILQTYVAVLRTH